MEFNHKQYEEHLKGLASSLAQKKKDHSVLDAKYRDSLEKKNTADAEYETLKETISAERALLKKDREDFNKDSADLDKLKESSLVQARVLDEKQQKLIRLDKQLSETKKEQECFLESEKGKIDTEKRQNNEFKDRYKRKMNELEEEKAQLNAKRTRFSEKEGTLEAKLAQTEIERAKYEDLTKALETKALKITDLEQKALDRQKAFQSKLEALSRRENTIKQDEMFIDEERLKVSAEWAKVNRVIDMHKIRDELKKYKGVENAS